MNFFKKIQSSVAKVLIVCLLVVAGGGVLLKPEPAHAQLATVETANPWKQTLNALKGSASVALMQIMQKFIDKVAYDAAKSITSKGKGKKPLFHRTQPGQYLKTTFKDSVASGINTAFEKNMGFGICSMPDLFKINMKKRLNLSFGLAERDKIGPCNWQKASQELFNGGKFSLNNFMDANPQMNPAKAGEQAVDQFTNNLSVGKSEFGTSIKVDAKVQVLGQESKLGARLDRLIGPFKSVKGKVNDKIKTPGSLVRKEAPTAKERREMKLDGLTATLGNDALSALLNGAGVFISTVGNDMLDQLLNPSKGLSEASPATGGNSESITNEFAQSGYDGEEAAEQAFSFLNNTAPNTTLNEYNVVNKLATCPEAPRIRNRFNCVIGSDFRQALQSAKTGDPLTIEEAVEEGYLDRDKPLISNDDSLNETKNCYNDGYCYSNIKTLRKLRILPLGFQIAAERADPDQRSDTLGDALDNFENCGDGNSEDRSKFCHLIDPNWVIKAPSYRCVGSETYTSILKDSNSGNRQQSCQNVKSCVQTDSDGNCEAWGYCIQEESTWNLGGKTCEPQYNTCTTYFGQEGKASSYLSRTVNYGTCNANNSGCRSYSLEQDSQGNWISSADSLSKNLRKRGRNTTIHFDNDISNLTCSESDWGCSGVFEGTIVSNTPEKTGEKIYLKKAPNYLGCYDTNPNTKQREKPETISEAKQAFNTGKSCGQFAQACVKQEVGCRKWTPSNTNGATVPGKIGNNTCNASCTGYGIYRQLETEFDPEVNQLDFIPSDGQQCPRRAAGCSEFTNLNKPAQGGERLEYYTKLRSCENPTGDNKKTFYTWEGKEGQGFQLKKHDLAIYVDDNPGDNSDYEDDYDFVQELFSNNTTLQKAFATSSPKYNSFDKEELLEFRDKCNSNNYQTLIKNPNNPDAADDSCRAFRDQDGNVYYRLEDQLRTVSSQCHELRKTETNLQQATNINNNFSDINEVCRQRGGTTSSSKTSRSTVCNVCRGGGVYRNGHCIYKTISSPGGTNSCQGPSGDEDRYQGCRAYEGTTAGNPQTVFSHSFEPQNNQSSSTLAKSGWSNNGATQIIGASIFPNKHSIQTIFSQGNNSLNKKISPDTLQAANKQQGRYEYELTFWARGSTQQLSVQLTQPDGDGSQVTVGSFTADPITNNANPISVGSTWQEYQIGPATFTGNEDETTTLSIKPVGTASGQEFFLDKITLNRNQTTRYLLKDSWQQTVRYNGQEVEANVPLTCDSNPTDGLPGSALGCTMYESQLGEQQAATEFQRLCREQAVGCKPVYPTRNNEETREVWYNVKVSSSTAQPSTTDLSISVEIKPDNGSVTTTQLGDGCTTRPEKDSCFIDKITFPDRSEVTINHFDAVNDQDNTTTYNQFYNRNVVSSTVIIPADPTSSDPLYLTDREEFRCDEGDKGCSKVAQQDNYLPNDNEAAYSFENAEYVLNQPENYSTESQDGTLCRSNQVGCSTFSNNNNDAYFKDPEVTGNKTCSYKKKITPTVNGQKSDRLNKADGWFKDDVGVCDYGNKTRPSGVEDPKYCKSNNDCTVGSTTGTCKYQGTVPCYEGSATIDGDYRIWSNETNQDKYDGFVGTCPSSADMCRKFVDRANDSRENPQGKPYYRIWDQDLKDLQGQCNGQASLKQGCVLFDKTDNPNKKYDAEKTYEKSRKESEGNERYALVDPVSSNQNDSNLILSVNKNRTCKQWWSCSNRKINYQGGQPQPTCTKYTRCSESENGRCVNTVNLSRFGYCQENPGKSCKNDTECKSNECVSSQALTSDQYVNRDTSFNGIDYSGHSVLNLYKINNLKTYSFEELIGDRVSRYLVYEMPGYLFSSESEDNVAPSEREYANRDCLDTSGEGVEPEKNWSKCGGHLGQPGRCWQGKCIKPPKVNESFSPNLNSTTFDQYDLDDSDYQGEYETFNREVRPDLIGGSCQIYPEKDSPFPQSVLNGGLGNQRIVDETSTPARYEFPRKKSNEPRDYTNSNVCQEENCSCLYKKVEYENNETDYYRYNTDITDENVPDMNTPGICQGGPKEGQFCDDDEYCGDNYRCAKADSVSIQSGAFSFCLEKDTTVPINGGTDSACLTWYPAQGVASNFNQYNQNLEAGYLPSEDAGNRGGKAYCLAAADYSVNASKYGINIDFDLLNIKNKFRDGGTFPANLYYRFKSSLDIGGNHSDNFEGNDLVGTGAKSGIGLPDDCYHLSSWNANNNGGIIQNSKKYNKASDCLTNGLKDPKKNKDSKHPMSVERTYSDNYSRQTKITGARGIETISCSSAGIEEASYKKSTNGHILFNPKNFFGDPPTPYRHYPDQTDYHLRYDDRKFYENKNKDKKASFVAENYIKPFCKEEKEGTVEIIKGWGKTFLNKENTSGWIKLLRAELSSDGSRVAKKNKFYEDKAYGLSSDCTVRGLYPMDPERVSWDTGVLTGYGVGAGAWDRGVCNNKSVSSKPLKAGYDDENNSKLFVSEIENNLRKEWFDTAYFTPIRVPGGGVKNVNHPQLFTTNLQLRISELDKKDDKKNTSPELFIGSSKFNDLTKNSKNWGGNSDQKHTYYEFVPNKLGYGSRDEGNQEYYDEFPSAGQRNMVSSKAKPKVYNYKRELKNSNKTRYVAVFYNNKNKQNKNKKPASNLDKFRKDGLSKVGCSNSNSKNTNWFAVGMQFDEDGKFDTYVSRACHKFKKNTGDAKGNLGMVNALQFGVFANMKNRCVAAGSVYKDVEDKLLSSKSTNKAFTNKTWNNQSAPKTNNFLDNNEKLDGVNFRTLTNKPFGSITLNDGELQNDSKLQNYVIDNATKGVPLSCKTPDPFANYNLSDSTIRYEKCKSLLKKKGGLNNNQKTFLKKIITGDNTASEISEKFGQSLFAKFFTLKRTDSNEWKGNEKVKNNVDYSSNIGSSTMKTFEAGPLEPPKIFSINQFSCQSSPERSGILQNCKPAEANNITVNGKTGFARNYENDELLDEYNQNDPDPEHADSNGEWSGLVGTGNFKATARFFAFANHNMMPIRRVAISWEPGNESNRIKRAGAGYYKNRKPFCGEEDGSSVNECYTDAADGNLSNGIDDKKYTGITCNSNDICELIGESKGEEWSCANGQNSNEDFPPANTPNLFGNSQRACTPGYFQFQHDYTCNQAKLANSDIATSVEKAVEIPAEVLNGSLADKVDKDNDGEYDGLKETLVEDRGLSESDEVCVYRPKVQVLDNWGWCNGDCPDPKGNPDPNGGCYNYKSAGQPVGEDQCNKDNRAWTKFKGKIIVIPRRQYSN